MREALEDRRPGPDRAWNRIPKEVQQKLVDLALEEPDLSPRELAVRFTDTEKYFLSEASVAPRSHTGRGCWATMGRVTSPATSGMAQGSGHGSCPRRAIPSPDPLFDLKRLCLK